MADERERLTEKLAHALHAADPDEGGHPMVRGYCNTQGCWKYRMLAEVAVAIFSSTLPEYDVDAIARAIHGHDNQTAWTDEQPKTREYYLNWADAVIAVLPNR